MGMYVHRAERGLCGVMAAMGCCRWGQVGLLYASQLALQLLELVTLAARVFTGRREGKPRASH